MKKFFKESKKDFVYILMLFATCSFLLFMFMNCEVLTDSSISHQNFMIIIVLAIALVQIILYLVRNVIKTKIPFVLTSTSGLILASILFLWRTKVNKYYGSIEPSDDLKVNKRLVLIYFTNSYTNNNISTEEIAEDKEDKIQESIYKLFESLKKKCREKNNSKQFIINFKNLKDPKTREKIVYFLIKFRFSDFLKEGVVIFALEGCENYAEKYKVVNISEKNKKN